MGASVARRFPKTHVRSIDASPFMLIAGETQNAGLSNLELVHGFAEETGLEGRSADCVLITLLFHECPDTIKRRILAEVHRILRPGGLLLLSDTPNDDLHGYRGFYEPYKEEWLHFDPEAALGDAGFEGIERLSVAPPLWTVTARRPA